MTEDKKERRRYKRFTIKGCIIQYKPVSFLQLLNKISSKYLVFNISQDGLQFVTREVFKEETLLLLDVTAPVLKGEIIHIKGRVVWIRASPGLHVCGVGIQFMDMEEPDRNRLQLLLDSAIEEDKIPDKMHLEKEGTEKID